MSCSETETADVLITQDFLQSKQLWWRQQSRPANIGGIITAHFPTHSLQLKLQPLGVQNIKWWFVLLWKLYQPMVPWAFFIPTKVSSWPFASNSGHPNAHLGHHLQNRENAFYMPNSRKVFGHLQLINQPHISHLPFATLLQDCSINLMKEWIKM